MKKLLATLGTITIAGTGISGVVGNAPVSMKVEINSLQKNNLEKLNRNKRYIGDNTMLPDDTININVRPISQSERLSCGPAVATSILRHFGLSSEEYRNGISFVSESRLIRNMETDDGSVYSMLQGGTTVENWINTMNRYIRTNNLNNLRQYSSVRLHNSNLNNNVNEIRINYSDNYLEIGRIIYNSLNNNTPVPLAFTGRFNSSENNRNHFILINGITIASNNISFRYMDPDEGTSGFFLLIN